MQKGSKLEGKVYLIDEETMNIQPLSPSESQKFDGFNSVFSWGYRGDGPSQLALAILLETTNDAKFSLSHYGEFLDDFIAGLSESCWAIDTYTIKKWIASQS